VCLRSQRRNWLWRMRVSHEQNIILRIVKKDDPLRAMRMLDAAGLATANAGWLRTSSPVRTRLLRDGTARSIPIAQALRGASRSERQRLIGKLGSRSLDASTPAPSPCRGHGILGLEKKRARSYRSRWRRSDAFRSIANWWPRRHRRSGAGCDRTYCRFLSLGAARGESFIDTWRRLARPLQGRSAAGREMALISDGKFVEDDGGAFR